MIGSGQLARPMAVALASVVCATAVGCGDSDDGESAKAGGQSTTEQVSGASQAGGTANAQVRAAYGAYVDTFYAKDAARVCSMFTKELQREIGNGKTCEQRMAPLVKADLSPNRPRVLRVKFKGSDSAILYVKTKRSNVYPITYTKVGGEWKVSDGVF